jgi:hypothetical protein
MVGELRRVVTPQDTPLAIYSTARDRASYCTTAARLPVSSVLGGAKITRTMLMRR